MHYLLVKYTNLLKIILFWGEGTVSSFVGRFCILFLFFFQLALICSLQVSRSQGLLNILMQQLPETQFGFINVITNYIHVSLEPGTILGMTLSLGSVCIIKESVQCIL